MIGEEWINKVLVEEDGKQATDLQGELHHLRDVNLL